MLSKSTCSRFACFVVVLAFVVLNLCVVNAQSYYEFNNGPANYSQRCTSNSDCNREQNLFCTGGYTPRCDCVPNTVYNYVTKECRTVKCDSSYNSCPSGYQCHNKICTNFCDLTTQYCNPEPIIEYYTSTEFLIALIVESVIAGAAIVIYVLVRCARRCKRASGQQSAHRPLDGHMSEEDDDLLRNDEVEAKPASKVYSFFLCFNGPRP